MLPLLSERISSFFARSEIIKSEDKEIYCYCFEILLATVINFAVLYLIAALTNKVWETTLFIAGFVPLRSLAGGYHAKTHLRCVAILLVNYAAFLGITYFVSPERYIFVNIACVIVSVVCVFLFSPVEDKNKPLSVPEKRYFKRRSRIVILIYTAVILAGTLLFRHRIEFMCVAIGIFSVSVSLAVVCIRNNMTIRKEGF